MRNTSAIIATIGIASLAMAPVAPALAQSDEAAIVLKDGRCGGFVPRANGSIGSSIVNPNGLQEVHTNGGVTNLICHFDVPEHLIPNGVRKSEGFLCGTHFGRTRDSFMMANPGGKALLVCRIHN